MTMSSNDKHRLQRELASVLDWDEAVVDGVVEAIAAATDVTDVEEINFMSESEAARQIVMRYFSNSGEGSPSAPARTARLVDARKPQQTDQKTGEARHRRQSTEKLFDPRNSSVHEERWEKYNTRKKDKSRGKPPADVGISVQPRSKVKQKAKDVEQIPSGERQRQVSNCTGCGKIFDTRRVSVATEKFIASGGICDFCEMPVNMSFSDDRGQELEGASGGGNGIRTERESEAERKAREFKDRLVDYDRNAAQRTTVLDDQVDYFEIDTNAWLEEKEKRELRMKRDLEEEMAKSLRQKVRYTIDHLGRRVFVSDETEASEEAKQLADTAEKAAELTSEQIPQGGGTAARVASETAERLREETSDLHFRVQSSPAVKQLSPIFLPSKAALDRSKNERLPPTWVQGYKGRLQHDDVFADFDENVEPAVSAADLSAYAELFETEEGGFFDLCPQVTASASQPTSAFPRSDVSPRHPDWQSADCPRPSSGPSANARLSSMLMPSDEPVNLIHRGPDPERLTPGDVFPDGVVLLKNWLSFDDQLMVVEAVRNLGIGKGGFYTPKHGGKTQLHLKMMCLEWNWNPVNRVYEKIRTNHDGASVPPMPSFLKDLTQRCLKDANRLRGRPFAEMDPNVCICNFYSRSSYLGLHQDKEEGAESLKKQIPVVSFSVGATGEFVFNQSRSMEKAQSVLLESGDAIVFGGPSRMLFHGIRKIFPESMPPELTEITGMRSGRLNLTIRQYVP